MLEACFGVVVAAVVTASLVAVVMAIADHPEFKCQYGNCDDCPFPRCIKEMVNNGRIHNRRLPRRVDKTKAI